MFVSDTEFTYIPKPIIRTMQLQKFANQFVRE